MKAIAFTEHGNVFSWVNKKRHANAAGLKYIHGAEFYVTEVLNEKKRDNYHCCLYAKNYDGVLELNQLSSASFNRQDNHFYYVPRITIDELINTSENIIVSTACLGGILHNGTDPIKDKFIEFLSSNSDRCFLEIQHHLDAEQIKYNKYLYELSRQIGVRLIAGTDTHALNREHLKGRKMLQTSKSVFFENEDSWDLVLKSYDELVDAYEKQSAACISHEPIPMNAILEAIENTNVLADMVEEFELDESYKYPHLWEDSEKVFLQKIQEGIKRRGVDKYPNYQEYIDRVEYELEAYRHNGAIDFMLLMEDIISWCLQNEIYVGYGRGSVNGSVIAWLLGITEMDSIKHGLNFERFMNTERVSLSDIDTDFPPSRVDDVKKYIFSRTGLYCCDIVTFNTIAIKGAIRDVCRAFHFENLINQPEDVAKKIKEFNKNKSDRSELDFPQDLIKDIEKYSVHKEIPYKYIKVADEICKLVDENEDAARKKYPDVFEYVDLVKGTVVSVGSHPCGLVVSPHSVTDHIGTFTTSTSEYPISQIYMKEIDGLNYVKLDLLRLDTIELINNTCKLANIERVTPDNLDIDDINVWNSMRDDTTQIFQWEGKTGNDYIKKLLSDENIKKFKEVDEHVDRMTLLSIGNSAIRPAGESYREDLANGVVRKSGSKAIDDFLKNTFGYLVFQCQIIDFLNQYCGFTMGEADIVRRHFAKKTGTEDDIPIIKNGGYMKDKDGNEKREHYIDGFVATMKKKYDMPEEESEEVIVSFLQVIEDASRYLFSLNHSQPYSYEGYASGWLRYYYPLEFITEALKINSGKEEKTIALTNYAKKIGIPIKSPKFRNSLGDYYCNKEENCIYKGIGSIKYMNKTVADDLYGLRNNDYDTFIDLLVDLLNTSINSRQLEILIKLDFFEEFGGIEYLLKCNEIFAKYYGKKQVKKERAYLEHLDFDTLRKCSLRETAKTFLDVNSLMLIKELIKNIPNQKTNLRTKISYQLENLGYIDIIDKKYSGFCVCTDINVEYSPKITLYALANGNVIPVKVAKKIYSAKPIKRGDIVKVDHQYKKPKMKKIDGEWRESSEKEWWISEYKIC